MVIYMSEFPPWNLLTNFDLWFIVDMKIAQIYKLTWVLYYNLNIFEFIYCLCYRSWSTQSGGHWETTGVWTLSRPSMTDRWTNTPSTQADKCRSRSILLNLRNYLIIFFFRPVGILKKQKTSICLSFFMLSIIIFKTVHIVNWSAIYMYIHLCNFMNELFSTIFYLLLSLPVRLQEIIFNCFFWFPDMKKWSLVCTWEKSSDWPWRSYGSMDFCSAGKDQKNYPPGGASTQNMFQKLKGSYICLSFKV